MLARLQAAISLQGLESVAALVMKTRGRAGPRVADQQKAGPVLVLCRGAEGRLRVHTEPREALLESVEKGAGRDLVIPEEQELRLGCMDRDRHQGIHRSLNIRISTVVFRLSGSAPPRL